MTERTPSNHSADSEWRDARLDALWDAGSIEEPSAAFDAALFAAARREVASGPRDADAAIAAAVRQPRAPVPEATRPERWWRPLAAAAVIGAFAVGLLQLLPADPDERAVVSDMPAAPPARAKRGGSDQGFVPDPGKPTIGAIAVQEPRTDAREATPDSSEQPAQGGGARQTQQGGRAEQAQQRGKAEQSRSGSNAEHAQRAGSNTAAAAGNRERGTPTVVGGEIKDSARDAAPTVVGEITVKGSTSDRAREAGSPIHPEITASGAPVAHPVQRDRNAAAPRLSLPSDVQSVPAAPLAKTFPDAGLGGPGRPANAVQSNAIPVERDGTASGSKAVAGSSSQDLAASAARSRSDATDRASSERRVALPVADWIALIRRLRDEGRSNEVAKELAAFREAHQNADQLLPPELREWRPPAR